MDAACPVTLPRPLMDLYVADLRRLADQGDEEAAERLATLLEGNGHGTV